MSSDMHWDELAVRVWLFALILFEENTEFLFDTGSSCKQLAKRVSLAHERVTGRRLLW